MAKSRVAVPGPSITFPIQMANAYLHELHITRTVEPIRSEGPTLDPSIVGHSLSPDGRTLTLLLRAKVRASFRPEAFATIDCTMMGVFQAEAPIDAARAGGFSVRVGLVLLWPYLRSTIADMAAHLQIDFPTLPTLDVTQLLNIVADQTRDIQERSEASTTKRVRKCRTKSVSCSSPRRCCIGRQ